MERALGNIDMDIVIVIYVDNILVVSDLVERHTLDVVIVIDALTKAGLKLKLAKCKIGYSAIQFMGAIVDGERRGVDLHKAKVFARMKRLENGKQIQRILGFVNSLQDFIPLFANMVGPLEVLRSCRKISEETWVLLGGKSAFKALQKILSKTPVLENLDWSKECFVETDMSSMGLGLCCFRKREKGQSISILWQRCSTRPNRTTQ